MKYIPKKLSLYIFLITGLVSLIQISLSPIFFNEIIFSSKPRLIKYIKTKSKKFCDDGKFNSVIIQEESLFSLLCEFAEKN